MFGTSALLKESLGTKQQLSTPRLALIACWFVFRKSSRASHESQTVTTTQPRSRLVILLLSRDLSSLRRYFYRVWAPTTHSHTALQSQACRTPLHVIVGIRMLLVLHQLLMTSKCDTVVSVFDGSGSEKGVITLAWPPLFQVFCGWMKGITATWCLTTSVMVTLMITMDTITTTITCVTLTRWSN